MKVFDISKEELLSTKQKWIISIIFAVIIGLISDLLIFFLHDRFKFALFLFIAILISIVVIVYCLFVAFIKLKTINQYLFILDKSKNSLIKDRFYFINQDQNIKVFNSMSYYILNFQKDGQIYSFYFLYNKVPEIKEGSLVFISHVDDIALDYEVVGR